MKITKRQLRRMIGEEVETLEYAIDARPGEDDVDDIEAEEDVWAGGANLVDPVDFEGITGMKVPPKGIEIMKITEGQLRRIIRQERRRLLGEQQISGATGTHLGSLSGDIYNVLEDVVMANLPDDIDFLTPEEWMEFEASVMSGLQELKERIVSSGY